MRVFKGDPFPLYREPRNITEDLTLHPDTTVETSNYVDYILLLRSHNTGGCLFVFLALQPIVVAFFHSPVAGFSLLVFEVS
jgi:hypothetical protein